MIVGFTGTRNGMSERQRIGVRRELERLAPAMVVHGDCVGADEDFDSLAASLVIRRGVRPCTFDSMRAYCDLRGAEVLGEPVAPMARNRAIAAGSDLLIACPPNFERIKSGSGTWATIRFGERRGIEVLIVYPDGTETRVPRRMPSP